MSIPAIDRAGNASALTKIAIAVQSPKLTLLVQQLATFPPRQAWFVGARVVYRLTLAAAIDSTCATNISLTYVLPAQLHLVPASAPSLVISDVALKVTLDPSWTGEPSASRLLNAGGKLCAGQSLTIDIPLVLGVNKMGQTAVSLFEATADGLSVVLKEKIPSP
ncbi:MAG: hypothetical protein H7240_12390 [Glaciimonas sp.]|nr:hypothetical protein [Glaciimonas sp.]